MPPKAIDILSPFKRRPKSASLSYKNGGPSVGSTSNRVSEGIGLAIQTRIMKSLIVFTLVFASLSAFGREFVSPYPSRVEGIKIPNTHVLDRGILRGMAPRNASEVNQSIALAFAAF